jgi:hypothetical protein
MSLAQPIVDIHTTLNTEGFNFGWSTFVGIGTILLAVATFVVAKHTSKLAVETKKLAVETTELARRTSEDVAAQFRPVLVPDSDMSRVGPILQVLGSTVRLVVRNSGNGPAIDIRARLDPGATSPRPWDSGALPPGHTALLEFGHVELDGPDDPTFTIVCGYADLAGTRYTTSVVVQFHDGRFRVVSTPIALE